MWIKVRYNWIFELRASIITKVDRNAAVPVKDWSYVTYIKSKVNNSRVPSIVPMNELWF